MNVSPIELPDDLEQVKSLTELLRIGKDEMNLAEFPMTSLSDKQTPGETILKFEDQIYDDRKKKMVPRKRIIEGSKEYGLPTATDDSVILALIQLTKQKNGFTDREVVFSRHELIQLLQWPNKGQSYDRIAQSLHRLASVTYHFENSWWDNRRKAWTTKIFGIIDNVDLNDSREHDAQGGLFSSRIMWNQTVLDSFQAGYLRSLDFQLAMSFKHIITMRIYRFMGKRFHLKPEWTFDLKNFSCEHIGLGRNYEGGKQIARKLQPALSELEGAGFLERMPDSERFTKSGRNWSIRLVQKPGCLAEPVSDLISDQPASPLASELEKRGIHAAAAAELVQAHPAPLVLAKIEIFDWLTVRHDKKLAKNPAGYLLKSITDRYVVPPGFVSKAMTEEKAAQARQADEAKAADRRKRQKQDAEAKAERLRINEHRNRLTPEALADLETIAIAQAAPAIRQTLDDTREPTLRRMLLGSIVDEHIRQLLLYPLLDA